MIRMILLTLSVSLFTIPAFGIGCRTNGPVTMADGTEVDFNKCSFIESLQSNESSGVDEDCAFIYHKVKCDGKEFHTVVSQSRQHYPRSCHLFGENDGFTEDRQQACADQALAAVAKGNVEKFVQTMIFKSLPTRTQEATGQGGGSAGQEN